MIFRINSFKTIYFKSMAIITQIGKISTGSIASVVKGPISKLLNGNSTMTFQYPEDLMNNPARMHAVQFRIYNIQQRKFIPSSAKNVEISAMSYDEVKDAIKSGASSVFGGVKSVVGGIADTIGNINSNISNTFGSSITNAASGVYNNTVNSVTNIAEGNFGKAGGFIQKIANLSSMVDSVLKPETTDLKATVSLYMPDTLAVNYNAEYNEISLADATNNALRVVSGVGSVAETLKNGYDSGQTVSGSLVDVGNSPQVMEAITSVLDKAAGTQTKALGLAAEGYAINPQMQVIFKNIGFREITMEFLFTPSSKAESDQASAIINTLSAAACPDVPAEQNGMYFIPPSVVEFDFLMGSDSVSSSVVNSVTSAFDKYFGLGTKMAKGLGLQTSKKNEKLFKFGRCVITNLSVDYAPNGWTAMSNGAPVQTRLTISLKEIEIVNKSRFASGEVR